MFNLKANTRKISGKGLKALRQKGRIPAILYGPEIKEVAADLDLKEFNKIFSQTGESSLINLEVDDKKYMVLVYGVARDPLTSNINHIDFYQPRLNEEVEVKIPIILEGDAPAVKDLGGTLVRELQEIEIKALPANLPHYIKANSAKLSTFNDVIRVEDLEIPQGVKVLKQMQEIVAKVLPPQKIEEELAKPIEEKVEEVEKVEKAKKEGAVENEEAAPKPAQNEEKKKEGAK